MDAIYTNICGAKILDIDIKWGAYITVTGICTIFSVIKSEAFIFDRFSLSNIRHRHEDLWHWNMQTKNTTSGHNIPGYFQTP